MEQIPNKTTKGNSMRKSTETEIVKLRSEKSITNDNVKVRRHIAWGMASSVHISERSSGKFEGNIDNIALHLEEDAKIKQVHNVNASQGVVVLLNDNSTRIYMSDSQAEELIEKLQEALAEKRN
jgi:hypothetical protein